MSPEAPVLAVHWEATLGDLLDRTERFPKRVRFTFCQRIDGLGLDILEDLVLARYGSRETTAAALARVDAALARLRALVRLSHARGYLDNRGYEAVSRRCEEAGRMVGGWRKQLARPR